MGLDIEALILRVDEMSHRGRKHGPTMSVMNEKSLVTGCPPFKHAAIFNNSLFIRIALIRIYKLLLY